MRRGGSFERSPVGGSRDDSGLPAARERPGLARSFRRHRYWSSSSAHNVGRCHVARIAQAHVVMKPRNRCRARGMPRQTCPGSARPCLREFEDRRHASRGRRRLPRRQASAQIPEYQAAKAAHRSRVDPSLQRSGIVAHFYYRASRPPAGRIIALNRRADGSYPSGPR